MIYRVKLTEQAKQDLRDIYEYIAITLLEPGIARNLKNRIVDGLMALREMPCRYPIYQEEPWKSRELRRINIGNYSAFYLVSGQAVQVIRIMYGGRDIIAILNETKQSDS